MPVKFKGCSEYAKNYKWNNSFRSATFEPKFQQVKRDAGLRSDQIFASQEPGFATKKHAWHREPQVQSCLMWWPEDEESDIQSESSQPKQSVQEAEKPFEEKVSKKKSKTPLKEKDIRVVREVPLHGLEQRNVGVQFSPHKKNKTTVTTSAYKKNKFAQTPPKPAYYYLAQKRNTSSEDAKKESPVKAKSPKKIQDNMEGKSYKQESNNIPLQRKAGVAHKSRNVLNRQSEYQRMYSPPRRVVKSSPLISALDIYSSSAAVAPPLRTKPVYRTTSEYNAKFCRGYQSPPKNAENEGYSPPSPSMKLKVKNMQNPQKPMFPHAAKKAQSEYNREFSPKEDEGIGRKQEIAEENKQRHEGSHIDPQHLMQVPSKTNNLWDMSSQGSEVTTKTETENKEEDNNDHCSTESIADNDSAYKNELSGPAVKPKIAWSDVTDSVTTASQNDEESESTRTQEINEEKESQHAEEESILEGRVTTPRLNELNGALRSHLDLTTPCKGGALLVAPPSVADSSGSYIPTTKISKDRKYSKETKTVQKLTPTRPRTAGVQTTDLIPLVSERKVALTKKIPEYNLDKDRPKSCSTTPVRSPKITKKSKMSATSPVVRPTQPSPARSPKRSPQNKNRTREQNKENKQPTKSPCPPFKAKTLRAPIRGSLNAVEFQHCGPGPKTMPLDFSFLTNGAENEIDNISIASSRVSEKTQDLLDKAKSRKNFWSTK